MTRASKILEKVVATEDLAAELSRTFNVWKKAKKVRNTLSAQVEKLFPATDFTDSKSRDKFRSVNNNLADAEESTSAALAAYQRVENMYQAQLKIQASNASK